MNDINFEQMQLLQRQLQEKYKHKWEPICPSIARNKLLWMMIEAGEMADIIKKSGDDAIMNDEQTRSHMIEEACDVLMYFNDVLMCYQITPEELASIYHEKHERNMSRWS